MKPPEITEEHRRARRQYRRRQLTTELQAAVEDLGVEQLEYLLGEVAKLRQRSS